MSERPVSESEVTRVAPVRIAPPVMQSIQISPAWARQAVRLLSHREREILLLLEARWTDREIADALCISYRTVTTHVSNIFDKLGVNSRRQAAALAALVEDLNS